VANYELSTGGGLCGVKYANTVETVTLRNPTLITRLKPGSWTKPLPALESFCSGDGFILGSLTFRKPDLRGLFGSALEELHVWA